MSKLQRIPISLKKSKSDTILDFPKAEINIENKYYDLSELNTLDFRHKSKNVQFI